MPSTSKKQADFMRAVAHSPKFAEKVGVPVSVGKEFTQEDKETDMKRYMKGGKMPSAPSLPSKASPKAADAMKRFAGARGMKSGGVTKMQVGGKTPAMPSKTARISPTGSRALMAAKMAARNARSSGMGGEMRNVPTLPSQASDRAKSIMAGRRPSVMPQPTPISSAPSLPQAMPISSAPSLSQPDYSSLKNEKMYTPEAAPGNAMGSTLPSSGGYITGSARPSVPSTSGFSFGMAKGGRTGGKSRMDGCCMKGRTKGRMV